MKPSHIRILSSLVVEAIETRSLTTSRKIIEPIIAGIVSGEVVFESNGSIKTTPEYQIDLSSNRILVENTYVNATVAESPILSTLNDELNEGIGCIWGIPLIELESGYIKSTNPEYEKNLASLYEEIENITNLIPLESIDESRFDINKEQQEEPSQAKSFLMEFLGNE